MRYMIVETFRGGDALPVYRRFRERGRMAPAGLHHLESWVSRDLRRCYQLMDCEDPALLESWMAQWRDLVEFEVVPVMASRDAVDALAPRLQAGLPAITAAKVAIFDKYRGEVDAWARTGTDDEERAMSGADWNAIGALAQDLAAVRSGRVSPEFAERVRRRLDGLGDAALVEALMRLASSGRIPDAAVSFTEDDAMMNRDEYVQKLKAQLDAWNAEVAKWEAKAKEAEAGMKAGYDRQLEALRQQREEGMQKLQQVQAAAGDAWKEMVRGADEAWQKMNEAFARARSNFDKK